MSALPTRPPEAPRRPSPAWLLVVLAAGLAPTALGADPLVVLTAVTTAASLIPKGADTVQLLTCPHCGRTTPHTELSVLPTFDCTGQVLVVYTTYRCHHCGRQHRTRTTP